MGVEEETSIVKNLLRNVYIWCRVRKLTTDLSLATASFHQSRTLLSPVRWSSPPPPSPPPPRPPRPPPWPPPPRLPPGRNGPASSSSAGPPPSWPPWPPRPLAAGRTGSRSDTSPAQEKINQRGFLASEKHLSAAHVYVALNPTKIVAGRGERRARSTTTADKKHISSCRSCCEISTKSSTTTTCCASVASLVSSASLSAASSPCRLMGVGLLHGESEEVALRSVSLCGRGERKCCTVQ